MSRIDLDVATTLVQIRSVQRDYADALEGDEDLLEGLLEGETTLHEVATKLVLMRMEADASAKATSDIIDKLQERGERYARKSMAMKRLLIMLMESSGQTRLELPVGTIYFMSPRSKVIIDDEDQLPQGYFAIEKKPNKAAIAASIDLGETVPGAHMETGEKSLTIRT